MRTWDIYSIYNITTLIRNENKHVFFRFFFWTGSLREQWAWSDFEVSLFIMQKVAQNMFWHLKKKIPFPTIINDPELPLLTEQSQQKAFEPEKSSCDSRRGQNIARSSTLASIIMQRTNRFGAQTDKSVVSHWCDKNVWLDIKRKARPHAGPPAHLLWVPLLHCSFWNNR